MFPLQMKTVSSFLDLEAVEMDKILHVTQNVD